MAFRAFIVLLFLLLLLPANVPAQEKRLQLHELHSNNLVVAYPDGLEAEARHITSIYPGIRTRLEEKLGLSAEIDHTVVIVTDYDTFIQSVGTNLIVAFANGRRRLVVLDYSAMIKQPDGLTDTLTHELCHLVLYKYIITDSSAEDNALLPRWLNEGICQWASGGASELASLGRGSELEDAVLGDRLIALRRLERAFPGDDRGLHLAYEESRSAVEYIVKLHGHETLLRMLEQLSQGRDMDFAVKAALDVTYTQFEESWQLSLFRKHTWFTWFSNNLLALLFSAGGALLVLGFLRAIWRYWHYRDDDEFPSDDAPLVPPDQISERRHFRSRRKKLPPDNSSNANKPE